MKGQFLGEGAQTISVLFNILNEKRFILFRYMLFAMSILVCTNAQSALLQSATPVSDGASGDNSIASGNTSRNLAVGADGTIYAVYRGTTGGIRVARSTNRGISFQPSVQVAPGNFEAEIAVSTTGIIYVTWPEAGNARLSRSLDGGQTFSAPATVGATTDPSLHMATDANRVYIIGRSTSNVFVSDDNGQTFTNTGSLAGSQAFSDIQVDTQTNDVIAIVDNPTVRYLISTDFGQTWGAQQTPGGSIYYSTSAMSSGSNGQYFFISGSDTQAYRVDLDSGTQASLTFGNNTSSQGRSIAADRCGNVVDGYVSGGEVRFRVSNDLGDTFGAETTVATSDAANVFINQTNGDLLYLYGSNGEVFLNVYSQELGGCYVPELSSSSLVFSAQLLGQASNTQTVEIINSGGVDVEILGISGTGDYTHSSNCVGTLAVGERCPINVTFTPTALGTRTGELLIDTNVFTDPRQVLLVGEGVSNAPVASFSPSSINFGAVVPAQTLTQSVTLENTGTDTLLINGFALAAPFSVNSTTCGVSLAASASCSIDINFTPSSEHEFTSSLTLDSNTAGAPPRVALSGSGDIAGNGGNNNGGGNTVGNPGVKAIPVLPGVWLGLLSIVMGLVAVRFMRREA